MSIADKETDILLKVLKRYGKYDIRLGNRLKAAQQGYNEAKGSRSCGILRAESCTYSIKILLTVHVGSNAVYWKN